MIDKRVSEAMDRFPMVFGLRGLPGKKFQINPQYSYFSEENGLQLAVDIINPETGLCLSFCRCTEHELANVLANE
jgi:hypothetical protein